MEEWRDIKGYEGLYQVSNTGKVKSLGNGKSNNSNNNKERILKENEDKGYLKVNLYKDGKRKSYLMHVLVATAFCENPKGYTEVNHINEDKLDNRAENLEFCSRSYNVNYGTRNKKAGKKIAEKNTNNPKLSKPVIGINKVSGLIVEFPSAMEASRQLGINSSSICSCLKGRIKSAGEFYWIYRD